MSIQKMTLKQYVAFADDRNAKVLASFPKPKDVRVLATDNGIVVMIDYGHDGVTLVGDSIGVYGGAEVPSYFQEEVA